MRAQEHDPTSFLEMPPTTALLVSVIVSLLLSLPRTMLILSKNTELACHIAIHTGPGGARAAICPTTTELFSSTVRVCFPVLIWNCGSCSHPSIPVTASGTHCSPHPTRPSHRLAPSSCSLPSPVPSPDSCHVAGLPWTLPITGLPSFWSAEHGR